MQEKLFISQKALITHNEKVLVLKEADDGINVCVDKRCLPWGRIESGETLDQWFHREIMEETGLVVSKWELLWVTEFWPKKEDEVWHIVALFWSCTTDTDKIELSSEHMAYQRIDPSDYKDLDRPGDEDVWFEWLISRLAAK